MLAPRPPDQAGAGVISCLVHKLIVPARTVRVSLFLPSLSLALPDPDTTQSVDQNIIVPHLGQTLGAGGSDPPGRLDPELPARGTRTLRFMKSGAHKNMRPCSCT